MPTKRHSATSICIQTALIVAGGFAISAWSKLSSELTCVEVMNRETRQWSVAADMPGGMMCASGVICGDQLYVGGGRDSKSVYSCSLSDLLQSCQSVSPTAQQGPLTHPLFGTNFRIFLKLVLHLFHFEVSC